ncbi:MAG TPA: nucleotide exchange factor GrpE [Myxococcaceae bacterium]|nr:nucleotide exchange factor GrpE [Myxococcaceae bacterium]
MAGSNSDAKSSFHTDISQDVIDAAVKSVESHVHPPPEEDAGEVSLELEVPETGSEEVSAAPPSEGEGLEQTRQQLEEARRELEELRSQLEFSQSRSRETMERLKESHERALRATADLENYKKRAQKEKEEVQKFGSERLLKDLLPVMDNLDRALEAASRSTDFESFLKGVEMTRKSFESALGKHGVKAFSAVGQPFDPRLHEAMQQVETAEVPEGHVAFEAVRGYTLNERLVRPALVGVARQPQMDAAPGGEPEGGASASEQTGTTPTGSQ